MMEQKDERLFTKDFVSCTIYLLNQTQKEKEKNNSIDAHTRVELGMKAQLIQ